MAKDQIVKQEETGVLSFAEILLENITGNRVILMASTSQSHVCIRFPGHTESEMATGF